MDDVMMNYLLPSGGRILATHGLRRVVSDPSVPLGCTDASVN